jgi:nucleoside-diphosphate-sugar epimerase
VNVEGTLALAKQAAACGVKRFVFISTVKVMGEGRETAYTEEDTPQPQGGYAISKWEAEQGLLQLAKETGLEVVILRPTLIYGERVGANFLKLMRLIKHRLPLPLGAVHNQRGLLYIGNVTDAIYHCLTKKEAAHQTFLIADSQPISTTGLIQKLGRAMQRPALLIPVPAGMCMALGALLGKKPAVQRLFGSLFVDTRRIQATLNWQPPTTMDEGLTKTAHWFMKRVQTH